MPRYSAVFFLWSGDRPLTAHVPIMLATVALGGHLRVGMEDNVYFAPKVLAASNAQLVERAAGIVKISGNEVATPDDARTILGLPLA